MRTTRVAVAVAVLVGGTALVGPARSVAAPAPCSTPFTQYRDAPSDFDDDGVSDLALGSPREDGGSVQVRWDDGSSVTTLTSGPDGPAVLDQPGLLGVGDVLATIDLNGDRCTDLVLGLPYLEVDGMGDAGGVAILYGDNSRQFTDGLLITRDTPGVPGDPAKSDEFGAALATDDNSGVPEMWIGAPDAAVTSGGQTYQNAGEMIRLAFDLGPTGVPGIRDATAYTARNPQTYAQYGSVVGVAVAVAPRANRGKRSYAGCVSRVGARPRCGDQPYADLGASLDYGGQGKHRQLLVGAPGEKVDHRPAAGAVYDYAIRHHGSGKESDVEIGRLTESSPGVPSRPHQSDHFGSGLTVAPGLPGMDQKGQVVVIAASGERVHKNQKSGAIFAARFADSRWIAGRHQWTRIFSTGTAVPTPPTLPAFALRIAAGPWRSISGAVANRLFVSAFYSSPTGRLGEAIEYRIGRHGVVAHPVQAVRSTSPDNSAGFGLSIAMPYQPCLPCGGYQVAKPH